jgi:PTS system nitrogen regulatory IIA component
VKDFLIREALIPNLAATSKEAAILELVTSLQKAGYFRPDEVKAVVGEIMRRENLGSTGIGRSVAIPHSRYEGLPKLIGTLGLSKAGIPFQSIDDNDVHVIFLLVSRPDQPGPHLHALETIVRVSDGIDGDEFLAAMKKCTTKEEMWELINNHPDPWNRED